MGDAKTQSIRTPIPRSEEICLETLTWATWRPAYHSNTLLSYLLKNRFHSQTAPTRIGSYIINETFTKWTQQKRRILFSTDPEIPSDQTPLLDPHWGPTCIGRPKLLAHALPGCSESDSLVGFKTAGGAPEDTPAGLKRMP